METFYSRPGQTIEAMHYDGTKESRDAILDVVGDKGFVYVDGDGDGDDAPRLMLHTNNGPAEVKPNHLAVKGVSDFYPCDPQTFAARWSPPSGFDHPIVAMEGIDEDGHYASVRLTAEDTLIVARALLVSAEEILSRDTDSAAAPLDPLYRAINELATYAQEPTALDGEPIEVGQ